MINAEFPAEMHVRVDDKWLEDYKNVDNAVMDCTEADGTNTGRRMRPRGISIGFNGSSTTAATATVYGVLWAENKQQADFYDLAVGVVHPLGFKFIYAHGTNGRHIKVYG